jgi:hypothetical protein
MSDKFRYYEVTITKVVKANNKTDAIALGLNRRGVPGQTLAQDIDAVRVTAGEALAQTA